jgi:hypothetical protein
MDHDTELYCIVVQYREPGVVFLPHFSFNLPRIGPVLACQVVRNGEKGVTLANECRVGVSIVHKKG